MSKNSSQEKNIQQSRDVKERVEELTLQQLTLFFLKKNSSISKQADGFDSPAVLLVTSTNNFTKQRKMITPIRVFRPVFGFFF